MTMYVKHINFYYTIRLDVSTPLKSLSGLPFESYNQMEGLVMTT